MDLRYVEDNIDENMFNLILIASFVELGIRAKVRGPTRLTRSPHGLKTNFFLSVYIFACVGWTVKTVGYAG
jgi:hypothetical protein